MRSSKHEGWGAAGRAAGVVTLLLASSPRVASADAHSAPDSVALAELRGIISGSRAFRVRGAFGRLECGALAVADRGLQLKERGSIVPTWPPLPQSPIPWMQIEQVQVARSAAGRGAKLGAVGGFVAGIAWNLLDPPASGGWFDRLESASRFGLVLTTTAAGAAVGALVGLSTRTWKTVYPAGSK